MYENGKMRPVETIPGMGEEGKREWWRGVNSIMIYCKNFCKCHNVPSLSTTIKINFKKKVGVAVLISDKWDYTPRLMSGCEGHFFIIKESINQVSY
jgi:hypothetical protein